MDAVATVIGSGRTIVATAGTPVALATTTKCREVIITAETDNTTIVTVGGLNVSAVLLSRIGTPLIAGASVTLKISDLSKVWLDALTNGDGVTYTYVA